jgi:hypothetical protein
MTVFKWTRFVSIGVRSISKCSSMNHDSKFNRCIHCVRCVGTDISLPSRARPVKPTQSQPRGSHCTLVTTGAPTIPLGHHWEGQVHQQWSFRQCWSVVKANPHPAWLHRDKGSDCSPQCLPVSSKFGCSTGTERAVIRNASNAAPSILPAYNLNKLLIATFPSPH